MFKYTCESHGGVDFLIKFTFYSVVDHSISTWLFPGIKIHSTVRLKVSLYLKSVPAGMADSKFGTSRYFTYLPTNIYKQSAWAMEEYFPNLFLFLFY